MGIGGGEQLLCLDCLKEDIESFHMTLLAQILLATSAAASIVPILTLYG